MFIPGQVFQPGHCYITHIDVTIGYSIFTKCHLLSQSINKDIQPKLAQTVGLQQVRFFSDMHQEGKKFLYTSYNSYIHSYKMYLLYVN